MDPERWKRLEDLFHRAADLPEAERERLLDEECRGEPELRRRIERLIEDDRRDDGDLEQRFDFSPRGDPLRGRNIGPWRLEERIAAGGMGVVYRATRADGLFEQEVAVKLIRVGFTSPETLRRFEFERRLLASLNHPNIARLLDGGTTEDGSPYLVMEFIRGDPIDRWLDERRAGVRKRLECFVQVCRAVHFAHQNLIVHRDIKPGNILIDEDGNARLLDFGIARLLEDDDANAPTETIARVLTPEFASPEQLAGQRITTASDVYSLGVVLYGLLTGRPPFRADSRSAAEWERVIRETTPTRPSSALARARHGDGAPSADEFAARCGTVPRRLRRELKGDLDRIVLMALRKEPERRYASAEQLAQDIERYLAGRPVVARGDSVLYRTRKFAARNRLAVASALALALALVFGLIATNRQRRVAEQNAATARAEADHAAIEAGSFRWIARFLMDTFLTAGAIDGAEGDQIARVIRDQADRVRRQFQDETHLRANLLDRLGFVCMRLDLLDDAENLMREALLLREDLFGEQSLEVALSLGSLGQLAYRRGEFDSAEQLLRRALVLHRTCPPGAHTDVALAANDLAVILRNLGRTAEARRLHEEALSIRRGEDPDSLAVAESLNNLAGVYLDEGDFAAAAEALEEALRIRERLLGPNDPLTLQTLSNLAIASWHLGSTGGAEERMLRAVDGYRSLGARGRDGLARALGNLATLLTQEGRLDRASEALREAMAIEREINGVRHPRYASLLVRAAQIELARGHALMAALYCFEALPIQRQALGPDHPVLVRTLGILAAAIRDAGRPLCRPDPSSEE